MIMKININLNWLYTNYTCLPIIQQLSDNHPTTSIPRTILPTKTTFIPKVIFIPTTILTHSIESNKIINRLISTNISSKQTATI